jgi:hypothetical protein
MPDDYTATVATTGVVEVDGTATGTPEVKDDEDWFAVSLQAGTTYLFSFTVILSGAEAGVAIDTASATGVITNDDTPPSGTLSIARLAAVQPEGQAGTTDFTFQVTRTGAATGPASATWTVTGGVAAGTIGTAPETTSPAPPSPPASSPSPPARPPRSSPFRSPATPPSS